MYSLGLILRSVASLVDTKRRWVVRDGASSVSKEPDSCSSADDAPRSSFSSTSASARQNLFFASADVVKRC